MISGTLMANRCCVQAKDTIVLTITSFQSMQYCIAIILLSIELFKKRDSVNEKSESY